MKGEGNAKSPSLRQVCKYFGCVPCKCAKYNQELETYYQCSDVTHTHTYGPVSCYDPADNGGEWIYRAYSPECPKTSSKSLTSSASTSKDSVKHYDDFSLIKLTMKRDTELTIVGDNLELTAVDKDHSEYDGDESLIEVVLQGNEDPHSEELGEMAIAINSDLRKSSYVLRLLGIIGLTIFLGGICKLCFRETDYKPIQ